MFLAPEPIEDLMYGTPPPEEASYNAAAYAEAYASYQCMTTTALSKAWRDCRLTDSVADDPATDYSYGY